MKNLGAKILKIMAAVKSVSKEGFNAFHKYKYVTDASIVTKIRKEMIANGVICIPNQVECVVNGDISTLKIQYTLMDVESGEILVSHVFGQGQDKGDKMAYKAATGAEKYYLLKTFLLPTDDDPENEKEPKKRATKDEVTAFDKSLPPKVSSQYIEHQEAITLFKLLREKQISDKVFLEYLQERGFEGSKMIPKSEYNSVYSWILKQESPLVGQ